MDRFHPSHPRNGGPGSGPDEGLTNVTTSGPNPWFGAQNHGFGPDVVIFSLTREA